jgi:hypothetical protein
MSPSGLTLLDLKNLLEWFEIIPVNSKRDDKFQRTQEKVRGLYNIHEDRAEPLLANLISATMMDLELHTPEELKNAKSLLLNRKVRLEEKARITEQNVLVHSSLIKSDIADLQFKLKSFIIEKQETQNITVLEIAKVVEALVMIDKKLRDY